MIEALHVLLGRDSGAIERLAVDSVPQSGWTVYLYLRGLAQPARSPYEREGLR